MIISEAFGFAFIHIPKCAGTTVREAIEPLDESYERMTANLSQHPERPFTFSLDGRKTYADFHHLTLRRLQRYFPHELKRLNSLEVYALVRDPRKRLLSAVTQRLKQFAQISVSDLSQEDLRSAMHRDLEELDQIFQEGPDLPFEYIHFQPQSDYIELDGKAFSENVFTTDQIDQLEGALVKRVALNGGEVPPFAHAKANVAKVHRFAVVERMVQANGWVKHAAKSLVPAPLKTAIKQVVYAERGNRYDQLLLDPFVTEFVERHYARDSAIFDAARRGAS